MKRASPYMIVIAGILLMAFAIALGLTVQRLKESRRTRAVPILMYHKIGAVTDNAWWVPTGAFERQLRALRNQGYSTVLPADLVSHRKTGKRLPPKPVMITFDDGYRDSLAKAEPLLKKYGFRAVVYLITDTIAETPEARRQYEGVDVLTWPEIKAMQKRGTFIFGGHGHRHQNLAAMADPYPDIRECYLQLRRHGIRQPFSFCYPHGQYNARTIAAVKHAGFRSAMVCEDRVALTGKAMNLLALPRVSVMGGEHDFHANRISVSTAPAVATLQRCGRATPGEAPHGKSQGILAEPCEAKNTILSCHSSVGATEDAPHGKSQGLLAKKGEIVLHVMHTGIPMEVSPRLMASGTGTNDGWLPAVEIKKADYEWRWPANGSNTVPVRLEIWDKHRLFPMFSEKL